MKKIVLALSIVGLVASSYSQGYVTVAGNQVNSTNLTTLSSTWAGGTSTSGTYGSIGAIATGQSYYEELLTSTSLTPITQLYASGSSLASTWLDTSLTGHNTTFAGRLSIGSDVMAGNAAIGVTQSFMLVAWSSSLGASWSTIEAELASGNFTSSGFIGWSAVGTGAAGPAPTGTPLIIQTTGAGIINSGITMFATPVPEPCTMALLGLGGLSLLMIRRRK